MSKMHIRSKIQHEVQVLDVWPDGKPGYPISDRWDRIGDLRIEPEIRGIHQTAIVSTGYLCPKPEPGEQVKYYNVHSRIVRISVPSLGINIYYREDVYENLKQYYDKHAWGDNKFNYPYDDAKAFIDALVAKALQNTKVMTFAMNIIHNTAYEAGAVDARYKIRKALGIY